MFVITWVSFENIIIGNQNIQNNFRDDFPHYYRSFAFIRILKNKLPQCIYLFLYHSFFNQKIFYFTKDNHFHGNSSKMHNISITFCTALNNVLPKFMSTQNLWMWFYLEIGSLQMQLQWGPTGLLCSTIVDQNWSPFEKREIWTQTQRKENALWR